MKIFDPLYGMITLEPWQKRLLATKWMHRLQHVNQLGLVYHLYPGANHSRLEHCIGTAHLTKELVDHLISKLKKEFGESHIIVKTLKRERDNLIAAAFLHDIGHTPFSHVLNDFIESRVGGGHKELTCAILDTAEMKDAIVNGDKQLIDFESVKSFITREHPNIYLSMLIDGTIDTDRLDYINRDSHHCGTGFNYINPFIAISFFNIVERKIKDATLSALPEKEKMETIGEYIEDDAVKDEYKKIKEFIHSVQLSDYTLAFQEDGLYFAEHLLWLRDSLYCMVYKNPQVRIAERMFERIIELAIEREKLRIEDIIEYDSSKGTIKYFEDDIGLTAKIRSVDDSDVANLMKRIWERKYYDTVFTCEFGNLAAHPKIEEIFSETDVSMKYDLKNKLEKEIAKIAGIADWKVIIDIPVIKENDIANAYIESNGKLNKLNSKSRKVNSLLGAARDAWFGAIYMDTSEIDELGTTINKIGGHLGG